MLFLKEERRLSVAEQNCLKRSRSFSENKHCSWIIILQKYICKKTVSQEEVLTDSAPYIYIYIYIYRSSSSLEFSELIVMFMTPV